jgi:hypothetical protein
MKIKAVLLFLLTTCLINVSHSQEDSELNTNEEFDSTAERFSKGIARSGEDYFWGVLSEVVAVDMRLRLIDTLDMMDAPENEIRAVIAEAVGRIDRARKSLTLFENRSWPKKEKFDALTLEWFAAAEVLFRDHLLNLAPILPKPDENWTDQETALWDEYIKAYDIYLKVDSDWVDYQFVFAENNGFEISTTETIDMDTLIEEKLDE